MGISQPLQASSPPGNFSGGQAAVQYILMVGIMSVAVIGVVQARFTAFKTTMQSVKHEMAQVIGGSRRLPQRWYDKEMEDYSAAVASLKTQGSGAANVTEEGAAMAAGADRATKDGKDTGGVEGEGDREVTGEPDTRGYGQGFYSGDADGGFGDSSEVTAGSDAGALSGSGAKKDKSDKVGFGSGDDFSGGEGDEDGGGQNLAEGKRGKVDRETSVAEAEAVPKKATDSVEEDETKNGSIKKATGAEVEEQKGGKMKMDWATIIKLILIIAIIVVLIILLLGSVGAKSED